MNASRDILLHVTASKADVLEGLKLLFPGCLDLQAIPSSGVDVDMTANAGAVSFKHKVSTGVGVAPRSLGRPRAPKIA